MVAGAVPTATTKVGSDPLIILMGGDVQGRLAVSLFLRRIQQSTAQTSAPSMMPKTNGSRRREEVKTVTILLHTEPDKPAALFILQVIYADSGRLVGIDLVAESIEPEEIEEVARDLAVYNDPSAASLIQSELRRVFGKDEKTVGELFGFVREESGTLKIPLQER